MAEARPAGEVVLEVKNLGVEVISQSRRIRVVRGVSLDVRAGEMLGIVGESGSGKSITALSIAGLLPGVAEIVEGSIRFRGEELRGASDERLASIRGRQIAFVFQDPMTSLNPIMRIGDQVAEPAVLHRMASAGEARALAEGRLRSVGIPEPAERMKRYPHEFSGGMRQRAMIATALMAAPSLIIADEPTTALDVTVQAQVLGILRELNASTGAAVILISHDLGVVAEMCHRIAVMYAGRVVETGAARELLARPEHPYTRALVEAMPVGVRAGGRRLKAIGGEPPDPAFLPFGCPFHPRCPNAVDLCRQREPDLEAGAATLRACWAPQTGRMRPSLAPVAAPPTERESAVEAAAEPPLIEVRDLRCHFRLPSSIPLRPRRRVRAVDGVSLAVRRGEVLGLVGETGCGKSTVARCMLRLLEPDEGQILYRGEDITRLRGEPLRRLRARMQPVFQDPYASLNPRATVEDIIAEPLHAHGAGASEATRRVGQVLELVGLDRRVRTRFPHEFSGGQRQRVGIARALALRPELIVADEPISALDVSIQAQILNLLQDLQEQLGLTLVFISHDLRAVRYMSSRIAVMFLGKVVEEGPTEQVCAHPRHPYTAALLSAVPDLPWSRQGNGRIVLAGDPPSPMAPPSGCRFRTRCPRAQADCAAAEPPLVDLGDGDLVACFHPIEERPAKE